MKILKGVRSVPDDCRGAAIAIGNFDGVHLGHQAVIDMAGRIAADIGGPTAAIVFEPHPRAFFRPDIPLFRLTPLDVKAHLMEALGVDILVVMEFNAELAALPARDFVSGVLVGSLGARHLAIGYDFHFGKGREGNAALLEQMGPDLGFGVTVVGPVSDRDGAARPFSSSDIRQLLRDGQVRHAADFLGYWWTVISEVIEGDRRGRTIGFPTANIRLTGQGEPMLGVYAVRARGVDDGMGEVWTGVANLGRRPTFDKHDVLLEVHLLDASPDLYGRRLAVEFLDFLRPERKFDGIDALKAQIEADAEAARAIHAVMARDGDPMAAHTLGRRFGAA